MSSDSGFVNPSTPTEYVDLVIQARYIIIINICLFIAASVSGALRVYVRLKLLKLFGIDDWAMLIAQVLYLISSVAVCLTCGLIIVFFHGRMLTSFTVFLHIARLGFAAYLASTIVIKVSVAFFMQRIFGHHHPKERAAVYLFTAIPFLVGVALVGMTGFTCAYDFKDFTTTRCELSKPFDILNQIFSVANCVSDLFFAGLAFSILWTMNMTRAARFSAMALFAVGATGGVASIMRVVSFYQGGTDTNQQIRYTRWSVIEAGTCATAACLFTLRPLFKQGFARRIGNYLFSSNNTKQHGSVVMSKGNVAELQTHGLDGSEKRSKGFRNSILMVIKERPDSNFSGPSLTANHSCAVSFAGTIDNV
ncbi:hypothetical protein K461DRAFT_270506 [Myriangium duriaei CBS 260.36]|uniref:Rhodopsin domain-containing protein n=1 Tax=Myriangium duriaei CBS 260.36 TaxID=1168546 RepID=A0A9P4ITZ2_9PEZI|nr:hypothetical protein K461DRAFT_270506 [Myriangium duriaei CBS 260.36]